MERLVDLELDPVAAMMGKTSGPGLARYAKFAVGLLLSGLALVVLFRGVQLRDLWAVLGQIQHEWLAVAFAFVACGYAFRVWRWRLMLRVRAPALPYWKCVGPFLGSMALNNLLPLRLGDVARATAFSAPLGLRASFVTGTMVIERFADLLALLLGVTAGFLAYRGQGATILAATAGVIACGALTAILLMAFLGPVLLAWARRFPLFRHERLQSLLAAIAAFLDAMTQLRRPRILVGVWLTTLGAWTFEGLVFHAAFRAVGVDLPALATAFVTCVASLATIIPSSPGYVGTFHLAVQQAAQYLDVASGTATVAAVVVHASLWLAVTGSGAFWLGLRALAAARRAAQARRLQGATL